MNLASNQFDNVHEILGIKVQPGVEQQVLSNLIKAPEVNAAYISLGEYDIIAFLNIEDPRTMNTFVAEHLRDAIHTRTTLVKNGGPPFSKNTISQCILDSAGD